MRNVTEMDRQTPITLVRARRRQIRYERRQHTSTRTMPMRATRGRTTRSASGRHRRGGVGTVCTTWTATFGETAGVGCDDDGGAVVFVSWVGEECACDEGCVGWEVDCGLAEDGGVDVEEVVGGRGVDVVCWPTFEDGFVTGAVRRWHPGRGVYTCVREEEEESGGGYIRQWLNMKKHGIKHWATWIGGGSRAIISSDRLLLFPNGVPKKASSPVFAVFVMMSSPKHVQCSQCASLNSRM